jgi:hypothetical protein
MQYCLPSVVDPDFWQWSNFEPEYDNDGRVVQWHESPAEKPDAPEGFEYLHLFWPIIKQEARKDEIMAAFLWLNVPALIDFDNWDGAPVCLDQWVPPGVPFETLSVGYSLNRLKGWPRNHPLHLYKRDDGHYCLSKIIC